MPKCKHLRKESDRKPHQGNIYRCARRIDINPSPRIGALCEGCELFRIKKKPPKIAKKKKKSCYRDDPDFVPRLKS